MSTRIPRTWYLVSGAAILVAVLLAGCTGTNYGPAPVTTQVTPTPAATTVVTTTTMAQTTAATTPPATTPPVMTTTEAPTTPSPPPAVAVTIQSFAFSPASVTVPKGTTVTWTNMDAVSHTIVNDGTSKFVIGQEFTSNPIGKGQTFSFTFNEAGTYPYHCSIHPSMKGTITVT
ncbi:MAG: cupredoxin family copper-binding protein [Methanomicrobiales archaeon]|nr:cupredoxin family copper-binding protein [Methanomicrobiales archaeon]